MRSPSAAFKWREVAARSRRLIGRASKPLRCTSVFSDRTLGLAGVCSADGRVTALMPHPERVFRTVQNSWASAAWSEDGGWLRLFRNARVFVG